jgi:hypothetical protein
MLKALDHAIVRLQSSDPGAAESLKANRASVINRALNGGNLKYPEEVFRVLSESPGLLEAIRTRSVQILKDHPEWTVYFDGTEAVILAQALQRGLLNADSACRSYIHPLGEGVI